MERRVRRGREIFLGVMDGLIYNIHKLFYRRLLYFCDAHLVPPFRSVAECRPLVSPGTCAIPQLSVSSQLHVELCRTQTEPVSSVGLIVACLCGLDMKSVE